MKIYARKNRGSDYDFLKVGDRSIYLGPTDGVGENDVENALKALGLVEGDFDAKFKRYEEVRRHLLNRIGRAVNGYKTNQ